MKRAPPRSAPPVGREEMLMIKKKVAPPKGPPPSHIEGFKPKSISSVSRSQDDEYRGSRNSHGRRGGLEMEEERSMSSRQGPGHTRRPSASRYDYDEEEEEEDRHSDFKSSRHESSSRNEVWGSDRDERGGGRGRGDSRERAGDFRTRDGNRERDDRGYQDDDYKSDERRKPTRRLSDEKADDSDSDSEHDNDNDNDNDTKGRKGRDKENHDVEPLRVARNGRDKVYNFRTSVLHANYKELRTFVKTPCEAGVVIRCYIERSRSVGKNYFNPCYSLCADMEDGSGKELITCRKMFKSKTPHYVFSMRETDLYRKRSERSRVYLGKLREVSSSEYVMFDSGVNTRQDTLHPCDIRSSEESDEENEEEKEQVNSAEEDALYKSQLCSIFYHTKTRPTTGLGMEVCVPTIPSKTNPVQGDLRTDLVQCFKEIRADGRQNDLFAHKCFIMQEKKSKYDPLSSCLVDFQGRASTASVKNFQLLESTPFRLGERQLAAKAADDEVIFQLGKISKDCFNMDFMYPLSMLQAFAIAVSRFDAKISW